MNIDEETLLEFEDIFNYFCEKYELLSMTTIEMGLIISNERKRLQNEKTNRQKPTQRS